MEVIHHPGVGDIRQLLGVDESHVVLQPVNQQHHPAFWVSDGLYSERNYRRSVDVRERRVLVDE